MTPQLPAELEEQWRKMATPAHLARYVTRNMPPDTVWMPAKHLLFINDKAVEALTDPEQRFLNVQVTVRAGKSVLLSQFTPVWFLGMYPDKRVIIVSYNETKAAQWGVFTRNLMEQYGRELFGLSVSKDVAKSTEWNIAGRQGGLRAVGVGGGLTGEGGDLIIIDDPVKNREEADSPTNQRNMFSWYGSTLRTRLMPGGTLLLTMARWNVNDLTGMIEENTEEGGDPWEFIKLPAICEAPRDAAADWTDPVGRRDGEALWPEKWPLSTLIQTKKSIHPRDWESLYQQSPTLPEGGMFKVAMWQRLPYVDRSSLRLCRCWDTAATKGGGDWTVGVLMGLDPQSRVFVLDVQRAQLDSAGVKQLIQATAMSDGPMVPVRIEKEKAGAGKAQIEDFVRLLIGFDVGPIVVAGSKDQRAAPFASQQQIGNVFIVDPGNVWAEGYIEEHRLFGGGGKHDDQVDASAAAFNELAAGGATTLVAEELFDVPLNLMWSGESLSSA